MTGLAIVGLASERLGGAYTVITILAIAPMLSAPLLFVVRETRGAELEAITGESPGRATVELAEQTRRSPKVR